jgi:modulator of FtsH protease HflK
MKADYLSYQNATNRSLLGLAIQVVLGLVLLVFSIYVHDHAAMTAAFFVLLGAPIWLALAVVFDQHRRERIESVEAEAFAATDAAASSVFEQRGDELRVAHQRLKWMYRFFIPGVSLAVAAFLIGIGIWRLQGGKLAWANFEARDLLAIRESHRGWAIAIGLGTAFIGFLFARYMSGMAKQHVWTNLRAGAAYAAGTAVLGLAIAIGHFTDIPSTDMVLRVLVIAYPVLMIALGGEIVLNFVLDLYRPRKPGEFPRPAFESRVLGFLAAPDKIAESIGEAINYQFGYDVTDSWVYKLLARSIFRVLVPVALLVLWGMTALAVVRPHERAMILRFGELNKILEPGLHLKFPWPIDRVEVPEYVVRNAKGEVTFSSPTVTGVRTLDIGGPPPDSTKPILWTNDHAQEMLFVVQPGEVGAPAEAAEAPARSKSGMDVAVLAAEVPLQYVIDDVEAYEQLAPPEMRDRLLKAVAQRAVLQQLSSMTVGDVLSVQRHEVQRRLRVAIEEAFARLNQKPGGRPAVRVLFVGVDGVHPPKDTAGMFEKVIEAEQRYYAKTNQAEGNAIRTLTTAVGSKELAEDIVRELDALDDMKRSQQPADGVKVQEDKVVALIKQAGGKAAAAILEASSDRWSRHMGERARLAQYQGQLGTYKAAPEVYRASTYLDTMRAAITDSRVFITDGTPLYIRLDLTDRDSGSEVFQSQQPSQN